MAKVIFGVALILVVCTIYSFAQDEHCDDFCDWADQSDKCDVTPAYCASSSDKQYEENKCNCCKATCIEMVGKGMSCKNTRSHYYKECKDGSCVDEMCV